MAKRIKDKRKRKKLPDIKKMWAILRMKNKMEAVIPNKQQRQEYITALIKEFDEKIALMEKLGVDYLVGV